MVEIRWWYSYWYRWITNSDRTSHWCALSMLSLPGPMRSMEYSADPGVLNRADVKIGMGVSRLYTHYAGYEWAWECTVCIINVHLQRAINNVFSCFLSPFPPPEPLSSRNSWLTRWEWHGWANLARLSSEGSFECNRKNSTSHFPNIADPQNLSQDAEYFNFA